jgi:hypothetical protein
VHDIAALEQAGIPGVFVASTEFESAAAAQGRAIGFHPAAVYVAHPIQDRTDAEMQTLADVAFEAVVRALTS